MGIESWRGGHMTAAGRTIAPWWPWLQRLPTDTLGFKSDHGLPFIAISRVGARTFPMTLPLAMNPSQRRREPDLYACLPRRLTARLLADLGWACHRASRAPDSARGADDHRADSA